MWPIIEAAGWPIYPLLIVSVIAIAMIIERLIGLRKKKIVPHGLLSKTIEDYQKRGLTRK